MDGQLDECDLTLRDLDRIRKSLIEQLLAMYHRRIAYPTNKIVELDRRRAAGVEAPDISGTAPQFHVELTLRSGVPSLIPAPECRAVLEAALRAAGAPADATVSLTLSDDDELTELNEEHMGEEGPTDVLSFPLLSPQRSRHTRGRTRSSDAAAAWGSPCLPTSGSISVTSSSLWSAPSPRRRPAEGATRAISGGPRSMSCASSSRTARCTFAAGTMPIRRKRPRCGRSRLSCWAVARATRDRGLDRADIQPYGCTSCGSTLRPSLLDADRMFGALADATRRDIVRRAIDGEEGVAELADHYPMSFAAVQKHVAILERAGLVTKERIGRRKVVRTNVEGLRSARRLLDRYEELWRGRIDRMTALISRPQRRPSDDRHRRPQGSRGPDA